MAPILSSFDDRALPLRRLLQTAYEGGPVDPAAMADDGDARHGTPDDPRLVLIGVDIHGVVFLEVNKPQPVVLYELMKGWLTGTEPEIGKMHTLNP